MSIPAERLREGQQIFVRGKVAFSRLTALITGTELEKSIERARKRGSLYPTDVPHTTLSLVDVQILPATPGQLTPEEQFVYERFYVGKSGNHAGHQAFSIDSTSPYLPTVLELDPSVPFNGDPSTAPRRQLVLERDLATGMDVTIIIEVFKPKTKEKRGLGLQQVLLNEPVRYYASASNNTQALAARGVIITGDIKPVAAPLGTPEVAPAAPAPAGYGQPAVAPAPAYGQPAYGAPQQGGYAPQGYGAPAAPVAQAPAYGAPAPQVVPQNSHVGPDGLVSPLPGSQQVAQQQPPVAAYGAPAPQYSAPAAQAPVPAAAPMGETPEQEIARLRAELKEQRSAAAGSGAGAASAFTAPVQSSEPNPWDVQAAPAYQG